MYRARHPDARGARGVGGHPMQYVRRPVREQVRESIPAVVIGVILILVGSGVLFWNEGRAVQTSRSLDEGYNAVIKVQNSTKLYEENNHKLVYVWGPLSVSPPLADDYYGVEISAVRLKRRVQMYQWIEEESSMLTLAGCPSLSSMFCPVTHPVLPVLVSRNSILSMKIVYSMETALLQPWQVAVTRLSGQIFSWHDSYINLISYVTYVCALPKHYHSSRSIPVPAVVQVAETTKVGIYHLSPAGKDKFTEFTPFSGDEQPEGDEIKLHGGMYYITRDIFNPDIGDLRVQFYYACRAGEMVSVVGQQIGETLHPYLTSNGNELLIVRTGKHTVEEMFSSEHAQNRFLTWNLRLAGWFLMFIGLTCVSNIAHSLIICSPLLRDVVALGLGSANLTLSMSTSLVIIGGAWCIYRPGLALLILVVAALPFIRAAVKHQSTVGHSRRPNGYRRSSAD
ncbi:transmembrane protein 43 homolog [Penaeus monodon]|uniref:transmembrane protein 43 homolog n=1 Tax=Penaeus monodon TaxID=6687 RepID=UPI0018A7B880|nr:transmembrane protein 43 homolog [Penaeus monodon]